MEPEIRPKWPKGAKGEPQGRPKGQKGRKKGMPKKRLKKGCQKGVARGRPGAMHVAGFRPNRAYVANWP